MTGSMEGQPEADSLSTSGDHGTDVTETTDKKKKESAKYIEKRGYDVTLAVTVIY